MLYNIRFYLIKRVGCRIFVISKRDKPLRRLETAQTKRGEQSQNPAYLYGSPILDTEYIIKVGGEL